MECAECETKLAALEEIMFFCKEEKDVHMTIKPEDISVVKRRSLVYRGEGKSTKVFCKYCQENDRETHLGKDLPFAPAGQCFPAFGTEKVGGRYFRVWTLSCCSRL